MAQTVSMAEVKSKLSEIVGQVKYGGQQYILERRGQPMAVLISVEAYEQYQAQAATAIIASSSPLPAALQQRQRRLVERARQLEERDGDPVARLAEFLSTLPPDEDDFWLEIQETR